MIETTIFNKNPTIVYHRISGRMNEHEAKAGAKKAISLIKSIINDNTRFGLIVDMSTYISSNINAHRVLSSEFKEQKVLKENVERVAIIGPDTPTLNAEKEFMESDMINFFTELELAKHWLKNTNNAINPT